MLFRHSPIIRAGFENSVQIDHIFIFLNSAHWFSEYKEKADYCNPYQGESQKSTLILPLNVILAYASNKDILLP